MEGSILSFCKSIYRILYDESRNRDCARAELETRHFDLPLFKRVPISRITNTFVNLWSSKKILTSRFNPCSSCVFLNVCYVMSGKIQIEYELFTSKRIVCSTGRDILNDSLRTFVFFFQNMFHESTFHNSLLNYMPNECILFGCNQLLYHPYYNFLRICLKYL